MPSSVSLLYSVLPPCFAMIFTYGGGNPSAYGLMRRPEGKMLSAACVESAKANEEGKMSSYCFLQQWSGGDLPRSPFLLVEGQIDAGFGRNRRPNSSIALAQTLPFRKIGHGYELLAA
ncbi:hypothetical protein CRG98_045740 [Punica granatum]|uniref:Uncharacterized protein n=1 Tax=Punica granatum TaxID=22663 RepID=A0A2I0HQ89_PUNGR|nr:hypothetical protein CRG98_045740 [Punica granatum]